MTKAASRGTYNNPIPPPTSAPTQRPTNQPTQNTPNAYHTNFVQPCHHPYTHYPPYQHYAPPFSPHNHYNYLPPTQNIPTPTNQPPISQPTANNTAINPVAIPQNQPAPELNETSHDELHGSVDAATNDQLINVDTDDTNDPSERYYCTNNTIVVLNNNKLSALKQTRHKMLIDSGTSHSMVKNKSLLHHFTTSPLGLAHNLSH